MDEKKKETFEEFERRAHSGQWDFEQVLRWYWDEMEEHAATKAAFAKIINSGHLRHAADCPMNHFYGKEKCNCDFEQFLLDLEDVFPQLRRDRLQREQDRETLSAAIRQRLQEKKDD